VSPLEELEAWAIWLMACLLLGAVQLLWHGRRYRVQDEPSPGEGILGNGSGGTQRLPSEFPRLLEPRGLAGPTHGQEGDGTNNRAVSVAVPGGGIGFLAARDVKPTGEE
jgi:hypothetical protein